MDQNGQNDVKLQGGPPFDPNLIPLGVKEGVQGKKFKKNMKDISKILKYMLLPTKFDEDWSKKDF